MGEIVGKLAQTERVYCLLIMEYTAFTNQGSRENNEDFFGISFHGESCCFAVADGLGGHGGGEIASRVAVDTVCNLFSEKGYSSDFFTEAFDAAQKAIIHEQEKINRFSDIKTTLVLLVIHEGWSYWAHVGDTRLYLFRNGKYRLRTLDHSVSQMLALSGTIRDSDIRHHTDRNRLTHVMGVKGESPGFECGKPIKNKGFQAFLLCTDGYWELVEESEMESLLRSGSTVEEWVIGMNQVIMKNGAGTDMDNYSAVAVFVRTKGFLGKVWPGRKE